MNKSSHPCPHCGKDKRNIDEIKWSIKGIDKLDESNVDEFDFNSLINDISAIMELPTQKIDHIRIAKLENSKKILDEYVYLWDEYDSMTSDSLEEEEEKNMIADKLIDVQKEINKELNELNEELKGVFGI